MLLDLGDLLLEVLDPAGQDGRRVTVGPVEFDQVALDAVLELLHARLELAVGEVLASVVDGLELAAIDGNDSIGEELESAAQDDELAAHFADRGAVVLTEVGDGLEVGSQATGQPHQLDVALRLVLQAPDAAGQAAAHHAGGAEHA